MEHPTVWSGILLPSSAGERFPFFGRRGREGDRLGYLALSEDERRREGLLNTGMMILPIDMPKPRRPEKAASDPIWSSLAQVLPFVDRGEAGVSVPAHVLWSFAEQSPNPESRVTLSEQRDALGQPRARLDWQLTALEASSLRRTHEIVAEELGRAGIGRLRVTVGDDEGWHIAHGGHHHMGTTRMHRNPREGVVDPDCRVHGVTNLYVAGSSVFPTSGCANPTLTLIALAVRLAQRLREAG